MKICVSEGILLSLTFTFSPILAIFWSGKKNPKMQLYDLYDTKNVFFGSELSIFGVFRQCSKMTKIGQKVKGNLFTFWPILAILNIC